MQLQQNDLLDNFSSELQRRIKLSSAEGEYETERVSMEVFVNSPDYMDLAEDISKANLQLLKHVDNPSIREAWLILGKGSGKSFNSSIYQCRGVWETCILKNPQKYSKLAVGTNIYFLNMATNQIQARDVVFADFIEKLNHSKCFHEVKSVLELNSIEGHSVPYYYDTKDRILFPKNIISVCGHSKSEAWLGYNTKQGILDEADWFVDNMNKSKAHDIYNSLLGSCKTRFPEHYKIIVITSPKSTESFAVRQMREIAQHGQKEDFWGDTWKKNPTL
jgi:DNA-binding transcriptional regulator/RsmH inhibitor MraZ